LPDTLRLLKRWLLTFRLSDSVTIQLSDYPTIRIPRQPVKYEGGVQRTINAFGKWIQQLGHPHELTKFGILEIHIYSFRGDPFE